MVDPPTRHADEMSAERPPSGGIRGRSTTVWGNSGQIDHRRREVRSMLDTSRRGRSSRGPDGTSAQNRTMRPPAEPGKQEQPPIDGYSVEVAREPRNLNEAPKPAASTSPADRASNADLAK